MKVLGIFAHPDDEVIFGWPIFQDRLIDRYLILCTDGKSRFPDNRRRKALEKVCKIYGIILFDCLSLPNNFYALPTRFNDFVLTIALEKINEAISRAVCSVNPSCIFTHNPMGEYGHGDHRLLFELVTQHFNTKNVLITDILDHDRGGCHRASYSIPQFIQNKFYIPSTKISNYKLDIDFYIKCKQIYEEHGAWTWKEDIPPMYPSSICAIYKVK